MTLWTIQAKEAFDKMQETGSLRADKEYLLFEGLFKNQYLWMTEQMKKRIGQPPDGVIYPVWAWYQQKGKRKRPSKRSYIKNGEKGEKLVLLTMDVPDEQVLLSDFDYWHFVLNDKPLILDDYDDCTKEEKVKSWELIFDYNCSFDNEDHSRLYTQATMWEIKKEWVVKAEHFTIH